MYHGEYDSSTGVFYATLSGDVTVEELAESLRVCFDQDYGGPMKSIWRISDMQINFALADATQLAAIFQAGGVRSGKMAFVSGDQGFVKSVVETVRSSRSDWGTDWQTFENEEDALQWVNQS
ncbi:MAG: hypothetical protein GKR90_19715 [Pseudomonadales bacterium]|nr:hypothetical protein [Pseudomonadales bacterium]